MEKNKLREIQKELIICEKPSSYLEEIKDSLRNTPLDALLILQNTEQNLKYHPEGNVWNHVMQVIDTAAKVKEFANDKESLMMGALLHDVGKGPTTKKNKQGRWISYNHDVEGVKLAEKILDYYNYENDEKSKILNLIKYHMHHLYIIQDLPFEKTKEMIKDVDLNDNRNLFVVSVILIAGIGGMTLSFGQVTITEVACALILGILTRVLVSFKKDNKEEVIETKTTEEDKVEE